MLDTSTGLDTPFTMVTSHNMIHTFISATKAADQWTEKAINKHTTLQLGTRHDAEHHLVCETSSLTISNSTAQTHVLLTRSSSVPQYYSGE